MIARRFLAVLVLASGPAWFTLASPAARKAEGRRMKDESEGVMVSSSR